MQEKDLVVLGAGWTSTFLLPLLKRRNLTYTATTTDGRDGTIEFKFDASLSQSEQIEAFKALPTARNVLITFPLVGEGQSKTLLDAYSKSRSGGAKGKETVFIQLGSVGIWQIERKEHWVDRHSPYNKSDTRAIAEDELLGLGGCVLELAGLWGGQRDARHWVDRIAKSKEAVKGKKSLHMIHGVDVARAIVAVATTEKKGNVMGQRWMLTDGFVYDWWMLFAGWAVKSENKPAINEEEDGADDEDQTDQSKWVYELMVEEDVRALPRDAKVLGRCYDSREFWSTFELAPLRARI
ncbi:hypothetical protein K402DRAFT_396064 [Aulographum hederae CBS 113979]|uniref:NAD(P)-binding protein n=1 Tax=Aulographum hederae CBS 113979 TaxID=1176131 RepID=A0A6G1GT78_9PEZI|nr:hypothetical protein K402DRAFT_396064 [Aulographum hederae CBS 113979]